MEQTKRRGFLKGLGLASVVAGGFVAGRQAISNTAPMPVAVAPAVEPKEDISHLAPKTNATSLVITGDNRPPPPPAPVVFNPQNGYTLTCSSLSQSSISISGNFYNKCPEDELNRVAMAVGKDDRLWIRVGEQWKRVVVEG